MKAIPVWAMTGFIAGMAVKHDCADFVLQTGWMAHGKERRSVWLAPLAAHAACHGGLTLCVALTVAPRLWWLALVDCSIHFWVDRAKTLVARRRAHDPAQAPFWWLLGLDQLLHGLTDLGLVTAFLTL